MTLQITEARRVKEKRQGRNDPEDVIFYNS
jgi:hypothetical protein